MRTGEICRMRFNEMEWEQAPDTGGPILFHRPEKHKSARYGVKREIVPGPQSQEILAKHGTRPDTPFPADREYVFDPRDISRRKNKGLHPRVGQWNYFAPHRYTREIRAGVEQAIKAGAITKDERWRSHQLRKEGGTLIREKCGLDAAQLQLGHADSRTTEKHYAKPHKAKQIRGVMDVG